MTLQLDRSRIAIRERGYLEILDLALHVVRWRAGALLGALALAVVPFALFNFWLLAGYVEADFEWQFPMSYLFYMLVLVFWETPLATAAATLYLGQAMFNEEVQPRKIARELLESLPQLLLYQVLLRPLFALTRPFLNEVILLDRNPMRSGNGSALSTAARSKSIHRGSEADPFGRWLGTITFGGTLFLTLWLSAYIVRAFLLSRWNWDPPMYTIYYPLALWIVAGYFAVVRFLGYLDLRIRREGWEVELMMRAEAARMARRWG